MERTDIGTYDNTNLICPLCGYAHGDMFESGLEDGEDSPWECEHCGKTFIAKFSITYTYEGFEILDGITRLTPET